MAIITFSPYPFGILRRNLAWHATAHQGCSSVTDERSPQDWSNSSWIIKQSRVPKVRHCMEVFHLSALTKRGEGLMKHGGTLTSHLSQCLAAHTETGLDFRLGGGGICRVSQRWGDWAILQQDGVIRRLFLKILNIFFCCFSPFSFMFLTKKRSHRDAKICIRVHLPALMYACVYLHVSKYSPDRQVCKLCIRGSEVWAGPNTRGVTPFKEWFGS